MTDTIMITHSPAGSSFEAGDSLADELFHLPPVARYAASLLIVALTTSVALAMEKLAAPSNLALTFVIPVVLAAVALGWGPSLAAAITSVLAFDFFFTEPRYSFAIASPSDVGAAGLLMVVAAIVSGVAAVARRRMDQAREAANRSEMLRALAHKVIEERPAEEIYQAAADTLSAIFKAPSVLFAERAGVMTSVAQSESARISAAEDAAASEVAESGIPSRGEAYPFPASGYDFWPITFREGERYVIGVSFTRASMRRPAAPERFVEMVAACLAAVAGRPDGAPTVKRP